MKRTNEIFLFRAIVRSFLPILLTTWMLTGCNSSSDGGNEGDLSYVAIGASDAVGIGAVPLTNGYVFRIRDALEEESFNVDLTNLGIPAAELGEIKLAVELLLSDIGLGFVGVPDLITIWVGANDIIAGVDPAEFEANLRDILMQLTEETSAFIVIANIPDLTQLPRFIEDPDEDVTIERVNDFNNIIESLALEFDIPIVDLFVEPIDDMLVSEDGFHPSNEGHKRIAELFLDIIGTQFSN